ncbi:tetratricopeptide repeat protein [Chryseobacterium sp. M5A1_1a]
MIRILLSILLIILFSCSPDSKEYEKSFDIPLTEKNEEFRLAGEYDSLVNLNKNFYRKAEKIGYEDGKALCYINMAEVNISLENYQKSQSFFNDAEGILKHSKNEIHQSRFYNVYGRFNLEMKRLDKAFEYNNEALNLIKKNESSALKNNILFNIYLRQGTYLIEKKQYAKALEYFQKARKLDGSGLADCAIGDYIYMNKNMDSAYKYVTIAYNKANASGKKNGVALYANTIMGEYYLADKQYDKAEDALKKALEIDNNTKQIYAYYTKYIYNDLRAVYEKKGDNEKAYFYLNAYREAKNKSNTAILKTINKDMESFIAETKNDSKDHKRNMQWVVFLSLAIFSLLAVYAWRILSLLRKRKDTLRTESEGLKNRMNDKRHAELMELGRKNDPGFLNQFKEAYPELINKLLHINPNLEDSELAFCAMLKLHFTSKEIASYTLIQHRTVQQKKYRIRKRLNIPTETDIYQFFDDLD